LSLECYCQHCGTKLPPSHVGECPNCHKTGKSIIAKSTVVIGVKTTATATVIPSKQVTAIQEKLAENEKPLWRSFVSYFKKHVIVDGFEIGFPSGIKIHFKIKSEK